MNFREKRDCDFELGFPKDRLIKYSIWIEVHTKAFTTRKVGMKIEMDNGPRLKSSKASKNRHEILLIKTMTASKTNVKTIIYEIRRL